MTTLSIADAGTKRDQQTAARALHALAELASGTHHVSIGTRQLRVSNLDKVLYPQTGFTKLDLLTAYARLGPVLVAHARRRPLTMKRYPDGVEQEFFFHKRAPEHHPDWVHVTKPIGDQRVEYAMLDDVPTLLWVANLAAIELHVLLAEAREVNRPTAMVFDLDPGEGACIIECCEVAAIIRETFSDLGLSCFAKTSGSKGVQVYVPLNRAEITYEQTKPFAKAMAELLEREHPDLIVSKQRKRCDVARCSSTGARMTRRRPRSAPTRFALAKTPACRRR